MRLKDKVAIITGAGQGIGLAYAERFMAEGAKVVIAELHDERGQIGLNSLSGQGDAIYVQTDIANPESAKACVEATLAEYGRIDVLLNNAAIYMDLELTNRSLDYVKQVFDVNVHGQWIMAEAVAPTMVEHGWGRIINQASIAAYMYTLSALSPGEFEGLDNYAYQHSKWSLIGLTKFMAGQLGPHNITVNAIAPGLTYTEATKKVVPDEAKAMFMMMQPIKREIQAEDMTGPAVFFASEDSAMVSGQVLCVDGGMTMPA
jgi:3-oxoacyl-[acyl-carrier protein] reductase